MSQSDHWSASGSTSYAAHYSGSDDFRRTSGGPALDSASNSFGDSIHYGFSGASTPTRRGIQIRPSSSGSGASTSTTRRNLTTSSTSDDYYSQAHQQAPAPSASAYARSRPNSSSGLASGSRSRTDLGAAEENYSRQWSSSNHRASSRGYQAHANNYDEPLHHQQAQPNTTRSTSRVRSSRPTSSSSTSDSIRSFGASPSVLERMQQRGFTGVSIPTPPSPVISERDSIHRKHTSFDSGYLSNSGSFCNLSTSNSPKSDCASQSGWSSALKRVVGWEQEERDDSSILALYDDVPLPPLPRAPPSAQGSGLWNVLTKNIKSTVFNNLVEETAHSQTADEDDEIGPDGETKLSRAIRDYHFAKAETVEDLPIWLMDEDELRRRNMRRYSVIPPTPPPREEKPYFAQPVYEARSSTSGLTGLGVKTSAYPMEQYKRPSLALNRESPRSIQKLLAMRAEERLRGRTDYA